MVVARNVNQLRQLCSIYGATNEVNYVESDIRDFEIPSEFTPQYVIHAATPASESLNNQQPEEMLSIIVDGQRNILNESIRSGVKNFLFLSSGQCMENNHLMSHTSQRTLLEDHFLPTSGLLITKANGWQS